MLQMFLVKNKWKDIRFSERIWYINNKTAYYYKIIDIDYTVKTFKKIPESETMFFHAINMMKHDFTLEISWLTTHNSIMNWNIKLWCYCLINDWIMIKESEVFMQSIQNKETVFWWD